MSKKYFGNSNNADVGNVDNTFGNSNNADVNNVIWKVSKFFFFAILYLGWETKLN